MSANEGENKALESLPILDTLPEKKEEKEEPSFIRRLDIPIDPDCKTCKYLAAAVCYGSGVIVLQTVQQVPASNRPARIMTGLFGVGLFVVGTLRLFAKPESNPNAPPFIETKSQSGNQDETS